MFPEGVSSEPDKLIDLLEIVAQEDESKFDARKKAEDLQRLLSEAGVPQRWLPFNLERLVHNARMGILPKRHSEVASNYSDELVLRIKHAVLSEEKALEKLRREVEAFENFEKISRTPRESIAEPVRMFVWQRDRGRCVKCGCQEHLEYDHIIPLVKGGSNTDRNIQLLCESYNRSKGSVVS